MNVENYKTYSEDETFRLGQKLAERSKPGDIITLTGDLGAGKTEFVKGFCDYFEVDEIVTSPTFTIINQYNGKFDGEDIIIYHIDLYRINSIKEFEEIGFQECINSEGAIKLIEWPEKANGIIPPNARKVVIHTSDSNDDERQIEIISDIIIN